MQKNEAVLVGDVGKQTYVSFGVKSEEWMNLEILAEISNNGSAYYRGVSIFISYFTALIYNTYIPPHNSFHVWKAKCPCVGTGTIIRLVAKTYKWDTTTGERGDLIDMCYSNYFTVFTKIPPGHTAKRVAYNGTRTVRFVAKNVLVL